MKVMPQSLQRTVRGSDQFILVDVQRWGEKKFDVQNRIKEPGFLLDRKAGAPEFRQREHRGFVEG